MTPSGLSRLLCSTCVAVAACGGLAAGSVHAQPLLTLEAEGAAPLGAPQSTWFGLGGALGVGVYAPMHPNLMVGVKLRAAALSDGDPPEQGLVDPGAGTFETLSVAVRIRPLGKPEDARHGLGLFLEAGGGGAHTGDLLRATFEAGLGWGLALNDGLSLAPTLRYAQVLQPSAPLSSADAHVLLIGAELALLDGRPLVERPERATRDVAEKEADADADGVPDARDRCPAQPEDRDGFEDDDGCVDPDDDRDKVMDVDDGCRLEPEDRDGFADEDGCPDADNDADGFLDADDPCPNEAEVINGIKDFDGCPDEGLFEMRGDRIVLEEQVLFDFERARVRSAAREVLDAIVKLYKQHPEWTSIHIEGHADARGEERFNDELSQRRAQNVMRELIRLGVPETAIDSAGYGSSRPRDLRKEEEAYRKNRRVEFVVVTATGAAPTDTAPSTEPPLQVTPKLPAPEPATPAPAPATPAPEPATPAPAPATPAPEPATPAPAPSTPLVPTTP